MLNYLPPEDRRLTTAQVAQIAGVAPGTVNQWAKKGLLPRFSKAPKGINTQQYYYDVRDVEALFEAEEKQCPDTPSLFEQEAVAAE
ncbi:helix-turn-helix domain-containing protein [Ruegeria sp. HKCCA4707]|uniref:helix-turn-helix domain-containing protein n=1 Tax=Ruegeria sp. HKCCA4707 TaxID=2682984 RepID=UPI00148849F0|nr:helix-turn-helix domain-containing protein [Ruegeria sp. HKCCA4707]